VKWMRTLVSAGEVVDVDIFELKGLLGLTTCHEAAVADARGHVISDISSLVEEFFTHQMRIPTIRRVIESHYSLSSLKRVTRSYILDLFGGSYDLAYVTARRRTGRMHAAAGVPINHYVSALHHLETLLVDHLKRAGCSQVTLEGLHKLFMMDVQFALDTFISGFLRLPAAKAAATPAMTEMVETTVAQRTAEAERMARTDHLTGLWNRRAFVEHLNRALSRAKGRGDALSLVFVDLDAFKKINDLHGHQEGDRILELIGQTLKRELIDGHSAYRYGGDEFCILMPGLDRPQAHAELNLLTGKLRHVIGTQIQHDVGYSFGIATAGPGHYPPSRDLLAEADQAMYAEKWGPDAKVQT